MKELVELTSDLIRFKTVDTNLNHIAKCIQFIEDYLTSAGLTYRRLEYNKRPSLLVLPKPDHAPVLLMSHIDVVDAPDSLFTPRIENGNLFGRGAIDDKYAAALSLVLAKNHLNQLKEKGKSQEDMPFGLLITSDEEIGGHDGAEKVFERIKPDFCIALDGGNLEKIVVKEKGLLTIKLTATGKAAHGARPWLGQNAIELLYEDYLKIKSFFQKEQPGHWNRTLNFSIIRAGKSFNQVPGTAEGVMDIRFTENDDPDRLFQDLQMAVSGELSIIRKEPMFFSGDSPYLTKLLKISKETRTGFEHGASDARFISDHGIKGIVWGAVGNNSAHTAHEHVTIESLTRLYGVLDRFIHAIE